MPCITIFQDRSAVICYPGFRHTEVGVVSGQRGDWPVSSGVKTGSTFRDTTAGCEISCKHNFTILKY